MYTHTHTHTMDCYSTIKKNENLPSYQHRWTWRVLSLVKLIRQRQILYVNTYICNLKKTNEYEQSGTDAENKLLVISGEKEKV